MQINIFSLGLIAAAVAAVAADTIKIQDTDVNALNTLSGIANNVKVNDVANDLRANVASGLLSRRKVADAIRRCHLTRFARRNENEADEEEADENEANESGASKIMRRSKSPAGSPIQNDEEEYKEEEDEEELTRRSEAEDEEEEDKEEEELTRRSTLGGIPLVDSVLGDSDGEGANRASLTDGLI